MKIISKDKLPLEPDLCAQGSYRRRLYFLCERHTGAAHCQVKGGPDRKFPLGDASALLAMHCMARGRLPTDYVVMVQAPENDLKRVVERTEQLLRAKPSVERLREIDHPATKRKRRLLGAR